MKIFVIRNEVKLGPYTAGEVNTLLKSGIFSTSDVARYDGSEALWPLLAVPGVKSPTSLKVEPSLPAARTRTRLETATVWTANLRRWVSIIAVLFFIALAIYRRVGGTGARSDVADATESTSLTRAEWRQKLKNHFAIPSGHQLLAKEGQFFAVMGRPDNNQHEGRETYWTYVCTDGEVELAFQLDPDLMGGQIVAEVSDE